MELLAHVPPLCFDPLEGPCGRSLRRAAILPGPGMWAGPHILSKSRPLLTHPYPQTLPPAINMLN
jgi:hypothetical protein